MKFYLYLEKESYVNTWVNGGKAPLKLASTYLSDERQGILTPDELLQQTLINAPIEVIQLLGLNPEKGDARIDMRDCKININGNQFVNVYFSRYKEDSLILCLSTKFDKEIAKKMNKKACIEITNLDLLISELSKQIGIEGIAKRCEYTESSNRGHFLKSYLDSWQNEYRIIWKNIDQSLDVIIPEGIAKDISQQLV